ncbi:MAG: Bug family tripartite tricarboxylate transporter substrate binding protein [Burkholderiales bacterium]
MKYNSFMRWCSITNGCLAIALCMLTSLAQAQSWPARSIRILVSIPPGGAPDILARILGDKLTQTLGQPVIAENRPGSNGNIAGEIVARAAPDGYTLLLCADSQIVINPHVYEKMPFDTMNDLTHIAALASNEFFLAANNDQPFKNFQEFIEHAKKSATPLNYGSGGNGSQHQLTMEMLKTRVGINLTHIPYKGATPAITAALAGEVQVLFSGSNAGPQIRAGKLRALATAGKKRIPSFADVPAITEFYPGFTNSIWLGLCGPRGMPAPVLQRLRGDINQALGSTDIKEKFSRSGALEPLILSPEEFSAMIRADLEKYGKVVKAAGVKLD